MLYYKTIEQLETEGEKEEFGKVYSQYRKQIIDSTRESQLKKLLKIYYPNEKMSIKLYQKLKEANEMKDEQKRNSIESILQRLNIERLDELEFFHKNLVEGISEEEYTDIQKLIKLIDDKLKRESKKYKGENSKKYLSYLKKYVYAYVKKEKIKLEFPMTLIEKKADEKSKVEIQNKKIEEVEEFFEKELGIDYYFYKKMSNGIYLFKNISSGEYGVFDYKNKKIYYPYTKIRTNKNKVLFLEKKNDIEDVLCYDDKIKILGEVNDRVKNSNDKLLKIDKDYYAFLESKVFKIPKEKVEGIKKGDYKSIELDINQKVSEIYPICQTDERAKYHLKNKKKKILIDSNLNILTDINGTYNFEKITVLNSKQEEIESDLKCIKGNLGDYSFLKKDYIEMKGKIENQLTNISSIYIQLLGKPQKIAFPQIIVEEKKVLEYKRVKLIRYYEEDKKLEVQVEYKVLINKEKNEDKEHVERITKTLSLY